MVLWSINLSKFSLKDVRSFRAISGNNLACEQMHSFANIESECEMGEGYPSPWEIFWHVSRARLN